MSDKNTETIHSFGRNGSEQLELLLCCIDELVIESAKGWSKMGSMRKNKKLRYTNKKKLAPKRRNEEKEKGIKKNQETRGRV
jgi:hypothetical protein